MISELISRICGTIASNGPEALRADVRQSFKTLRLAVDATPEELKKAYRDLKDTWDPIRFSYDRRLEQRVREVSRELDQAYFTIARHLHLEHQMTFPWGDE